MGKDLSSEVILEIADKCSFKQLKQADATLKDKGMPKLETMSAEDIEKKKKAGPTNMYRKGKKTLTISILMDFPIHIDTTRKYGFVHFVPNDVTGFILLVCEPRRPWRECIFFCRVT